MGFKRNASYLMFLRVAIILSGIVTSTIVARALGPEGKGRLELAVIVFPMLVASMGSLGMRASSVFFSSHQGGARNVARITLTISLLAGLVYAGAVLLLRDSDLIQNHLLKGLPHHFIILSACLIPVYLLWNTGDGLLQGRFRFGTHVSIYLSGLVLKLLGVVIFIGFLGYKLMGAVAIFALAAIIPAVITLIFVIKQKVKGRYVHPKKVISYSLQAWWGAAAQRANLQMDSLVVNALFDNATLGVYSIATLFSRPLLQIPGALSQALFPRVASSDPEQAALDCALLNRNWLWMGALMGGVVCVLAGFIIGPVFGEAFAPATHALWAMIPGIVAFGMSAILAQYLSGTGKPQLTSTASVIALAANIPALFFLVPKFGIVGAGLSLTISHIVRAVSIAVFFQRNSTLKPRYYLLPRAADLSYYKRGFRFLKKKLSGNA